MQNDDCTVRAESTFALRDETTNERMEVPWALLDLICYEYEKEKIKASMGPNMMNNDKLPLIHRDTTVISEHQIQVPANPSLTKEQITKLHISIKAAQERWGISYKDAAHRLYLQKMAKVQAEMAEVERLKSIAFQVQRLIRETNRRH
ncbi:hypothetical protein BDN71DRAFT_1499558 [Pleurotus eryngii]|uniref:Uncharacterized protein n=1 Tax=Pleurotus eryngii TaxID=5323 RepID=A0A9P5ZI92_PLEER|nr:hypothetical protein BDN71DRAFT_1499558 [Pleurotus eryngii]